MKAGRVERSGHYKYLRGAATEELLLATRPLAAVLLSCAAVYPQ